jgi:hypothetical protein
MGIHTKVEIVEEVVEVNLPVKLCIGRLWKGTASLFSTTPTLQKFLIDIEGMAQVFRHLVV